MGRRSKRRRTKTVARLDRRRIAIAVAAGLIGQAIVMVSYRGVLAEYYARRAQNAIAAGEYQQALKPARRAQSLNSAHGYAAMFEGVALRRLRQDKQAAAVLHRAMRTVAHRSNAVRHLAICEEQLGQTEDAIRHFAEAGAIEPRPSGGPGELQGRLGRLLLTQLRWAEGTARFRGILSESPESRFPFDALALAYEHFGARDLAVACACALVLSERHAARACDHLDRLVGPGMGHRRLVAAALAEARKHHPPGKPARQAIDQLLEKVTDDE